MIGFFQRCRSPRCLLLSYGGRSVDRKSKQLSGVSFGRPHVTDLCEDRPKSKIQTLSVCHAPYKTVTKPDKCRIKIKATVIVRVPLLLPPTLPLLLLYLFLFSLFTRAPPGLCACVKVKSPPSDVSAVHTVSSTCRQAPAYSICVFVTVADV